MIDELNNELYLSISSDSLGIYLIDKKKFLYIYNEEIKISNDFEELNLEILKKFLDDNIFKIEKLIGKFLENISIIIENKKIFNLYFGIKKTNFENIIKEKHLEKIVIEAKDLFKKNYPSNRIMHILIKKYLINGESFSTFIKNLNSDQICLEMHFISVPIDFVLTIEKVLEKYQIKIIRYLDHNYITSYSMGNSVDYPQAVEEIKSGNNKNEVVLVQKNPKKLGLFEKFFQLFS